MILIPERLLLINYKRTECEPSQFGNNRGRITANFLLNIVIILLTMGVSHPQQSITKFINLKKI